MICQKCGKSLPGEGTVCKFCGAMMTQSQIEENKKFQTNLMQAQLKSDRYAVDRSAIYEKDDNKKNDKALAIAVILGILLFLVIMVIIINIGDR